MSADIAAKLRLLAQDYQDGRLDLAAYRALRAPLLDSLVVDVYSVKAAMEVTQPRAATRLMDHEITQPGKPLAQPRTQLSSQSAQSIGRSEARPPSKKLRAGVVASAVFVLVAAVIAAIVWRGQSAERNSVETGESVHSGAGGDAAGLAAVRRLIEEFTDRGDWSEGRLAPLNAALLELGGSRMAAAAREAWFQRFVDELRRRLKEQQALAPGMLTADNSPLAALAVTVGFDLKSPDAAIHIASLPPPPAPEMHGAPTDAKADRSEAHRASEKAPQGEVVEPAPAQSSAVATSVATPAAAAAPTTGGTSATQNTCRIELIRSRRPLCQDRLPAGTEGPLLAMVPAGAFEMGSAAASDEQPVHRVTIREPFAISVYEVSQGDFKQFCEHTKYTCAPQPWTGDDYPVVNVSWDDARAYAEWLSSVTRHRYSLPTEAQWEYAARAGQAGPFPGGDSLSPTDAHYSMLAKQTAAVRRDQKFNANAFRLVHTLGNVREWVEDAWAPGFAGASNDGSAMKLAQGAMRVARGGSYSDGAARLRLSMREGLPASTRDSTTGFRVVRELSQGVE